MKKALSFIAVFFLGLFIGAKVLRPSHVTLTVQPPATPTYVVEIPGRSEIVARQKQKCLCGPDQTEEMSAAWQALSR